MSEFQCAYGEIHGASEFRNGMCPCGGTLHMMDGKTNRQLEAEERDDEEREEE